jgi:hypothetical protein
MPKRQSPRNVQIVAAVISAIAIIIAAIITVSPNIIAFMQKTPTPTATPTATSTLQPVLITTTATKTSELPPGTPSLVATTPTPIPSPTQTPAPTPVLEQVVDNFDSYSNTFVQDNFKINRNAGNDASLRLAGIPHVNQGTQALAFEYEIRYAPPRNYVGFDRALPVQDWSKYSKLCLWVESDGSNRNLVIQFGEHNNNFRKSIFSLSKGTMDYCVPLSAQPPIDLRFIGYYGVYVEGPPQGQGVIYIDNVRLGH